MLLLIYYIVALSVINFESYVKSEDKFLTDSRKCGESENLLKLF